MKNIQKLAGYLSHSLAFNCFVSDGNTRKLNQTLFFNSHTKDTAIIRINYWNKTVIEFPGVSGHKFYQLMKSGRVSWGLFHPTSLKLTRLDIYYYIL